jgi:hypothetical protein
MLGLGLSSQAQVLLNQDFQGDLSNILIGYPAGTATDVNWYDHDDDLMADGSPSGRPGEWFLAYPFAIADSLTGTGDTNFVMASNSWTNDFSTPVANWLITESVALPTGVTSIALRWKSAPYQTPLYLDGYTVKLATANNDLPSFTTTLYNAAQYSDEGGAYPSYGCVFADYEFLPAGAWVHGWDGTADVPSGLEDSGDCSRWLGILTQKTVDLTAYAGQTVFIAFVHNSNDDNLLSLDDIQIEAITSVAENNGVSKLNVYPNPAVDMITFEFTASASAMGILEVTDVFGRLVATQSLGALNEGANKVAFDASSLANGTYNVKIRSDKGVTTTSFIKK